MIPTARARFMHKEATMKCRSCGETIAFISTKNGRLMPVQPGAIRIISRDGEIVEGFKPHWNECPGANSHRRKAAEGKKNDSRQADTSTG